MDERELTIQFNSDIAEGDSNARIAFYANIGCIKKIVVKKIFSMKQACFLPIECAFFGFEFDKNRIVNIYKVYIKISKK